MNFGEDPFPHRAQQPQEISGTSSGSRAAASQLRVKVQHQPYDASDRPAVVRRRLQAMGAEGVVDSPTLADIPVRRSAVRRSARLRHMKPVEYAEEGPAEVRISFPTQCPRLTYFHCAGGGARGAQAHGQALAP